MSSDDLAAFWVHVVSVRTYTGTTGAGVKQYANAANRDVFVERKRRFVRDATGNQVISESSVYADSSFAADFAPQSQVTLPGETMATTVLACGVNTSGDLDLPDHIVASLQ